MGIKSAKQVMEAAERQASGPVVVQRLTVEILDDNQIRISGPADPLLTLKLFIEGLAALSQKIESGRNQGGNKIQVVPGGAIPKATLNGQG